MGNEPVINDPTLPHPPRYWWLKRLSLGMAVMFFVIIGLRVWWGYEAHRRLYGFIAAADARGIPIRPEQFKSAYVPDDQNAALDYMKVTERHQPLATAWKKTVWLIPLDRQLTSSEVDLIAPVVVDHADRLALLRVARAKPGFDWKMNRPVPVSMRAPIQLSSVAYSAVRLHLARGDHHEAVETLRDINHYASGVGASSPVHIAHTMRIVMLKDSAAHVENLCDALAVTGAAEAAIVSRPVERTNVVALIKDLLDDDNVRASASRVAQCNSTLAMDVIDQLKISGGKGLWWYKPSLLTSLHHMMQHHRASAEALKSEFYVDYKTLAPPAVVVPSPSLTGYARFLEVMTAQSDSWVDNHFSCLKKRRAAAVRLAAKLYMLEHDGQSPPSAEALVPEYLPYLPADPMDPNRGPTTLPSLK